MAKGSSGGSGLSGGSGVNTLIGSSGAIPAAPTTGGPVQWGSVGPPPNATQGSAQALTPEEAAQLRDWRSQLGQANGASGPGSAAMLRSLMGQAPTMDALAKRELAGMTEQQQIQNLRDQMARMMAGRGGGYSVRGERGGNTFGGGSPSNSAGMGGLSSGGLY